MSGRIRIIKQADARKLLVYFRKLVIADPEQVETVDDARCMTLRDGEKWILGKLAKMLAGNLCVSCLEIDGSEIVALGEVERLPRPIEYHMGEIRLGILPEYADRGHEMVQSLCRHARYLGIRSLLYINSETQKIGIGIMENCGFLRMGCISGYYKSGNTYTDGIIMLLPDIKSIFLK